MLQIEVLENEGDRLKSFKSPGILKSCKKRYSVKAMAINRRCAGCRRVLFEMMLSVYVLVNVPPLSGGLLARLSVWSEVQTCI